MENLDSALSAINCREHVSNIINFAAKICDNTTEFVIVKFNNQDLFLITQFQKVASLYKVEIDSPNAEITVSETVYSVSHISGSENPKALGAIRFLAENLGLNKTTYIFFDLKSYEKSVVTDIFEAIQHKTRLS